MMRQISLMTKQNLDEGLKQCPSCRKKIPDSVVGCPYCGKIQPEYEHLIRLYEKQRGKKLEQ